MPVFTVTYHTRNTTGLILQLFETYPSVTESEQRPESIMEMSDQTASNVTKASIPPHTLCGGVMSRSSTQWVGIGTLGPSQSANGSSSFASLSPPSDIYDPRLYSGGFPWAGGGPGGGR